MRAFKLAGGYRLSNEHEPARLPYPQGSGGYFRSESDSVFPSFLSAAEEAKEENGGLIPTDEEFAFQAPEAGYQMSIVTDAILQLRPTVPTLANPKILSNGGFQFTFSNSVGALLGVLTTTNIALPVTNWTVLSGVTEIAPGQFQFTDLDSTNSPQLFYRLRSP